MHRGEENMHLKFVFTLYLIFDTVHYQCEKHLNQ